MSISNICYRYEFAPKIESIDFFNTSCVELFHKIRFLDIVVMALYPLFVGSVMILGSVLIDELFYQCHSARVTFTRCVF